ncbi:hypothetical protein KCP69_07295 [Salmonella enterica subsp. enterica]|nr:hypothetical protein KCP69_07295 [Salmonella enterica subsp. enterica]
MFTTGDGPAERLILAGWDILGNAAYILSSSVVGLWAVSRLIFCRGVAGGTDVLHYWRL